MRKPWPLAFLALTATVGWAFLPPPVAPATPSTLPTPTDQLLARMPLFPPDDPWNQDITRLPVDKNSDVYINSIGPDKPLHPDFGTRYGIPFQFVDGKTPRHRPRFEYADQSDKGPYPIPADVLIEGPPGAADGDRHILCIDKDSWILYELYRCIKSPAGWDCGSGAVFDLRKHPARPQGWTSADAAGLPIFPGLARYDEAVLRKNIPHALRFTVQRTRRAYVAPATHFASRSNDPRLPPMGMRVRLKAAFDLTPYPPEVQPILACLKKYGMILADNGSDWFISGAPDPRWNDETLNALKKVRGRDLEVVKMGPLITK